VGLDLSARVGEQRADGGGGALELAGVVARQPDRRDLDQRATSSAACFAICAGRVSSSASALIVALHLGLERVERQ
jgi:hypothetical protein